MLLGRRPYLKAKAGGESSMVGKAGHDESREACAGRGPDGTVKATLLEPQCPICNRSTRACGMTPWVPGKPNHSASVETRSEGTRPPIAVGRTRTRHLTHPERQLRAERGIAYRGRPPRRRRLRSSPSQGKPGAWRREPGKSDARMRRYA